MSETLCQMYSIFISLFVKEDFPIVSMSLKNINFLRSGEMAKNVCFDYNINSSATLIQIGQIS